jgi:hypothetical protein
MFDGFAFFLTLFGGSSLQRFEGTGLRHWKKSFRVFRGNSHEAAPSVLNMEKEIALLTSCLCNVMLCCAPIEDGRVDCRWQVRVVDGGYGLSMGGAGLVVGWCGSGCWVVAGRCWVLVRRYSSLSCTVRVGYGRGGGCAVVVVVPAVIVVAVFFLVATCRFKDTGCVSLFEAGKMRENGP